MTTSLLSDSWSESTIADTYVNATERPVLYYSFYLAEKYIRMIYPPFMLLFGTFGNIMIILIMRRATSGESTIHIYFTTTALFDLVVCTYTLSQWSSFTLGFDVKAVHSVFCKVHTWLYAGGRAISAWCLVCMTVHRAMSVVWPHRVNVLCTRRTVLLVLTGIIVFIALLYSHAMIGFDRIYSHSRRRYWCSVRNDDKVYVYFFENFVIYKDLSVFCLLPFTFLVLSNGILIWKLGVSVKETKRQLAQGDSGQVQSREKAANSVTLMVIVVSLAFIVLTLPTSINFMTDYLTIHHNRISGHELAKKGFIYALGESLSDTNSALNFYLYCLTGRRFREEFIKVMCCRRNRERRAVSQ